MVRVLLIDDDELNLEQMSLLLKSEGHEVITMHSGLGGLAALLDKEVDIIFTDLDMPIMSGEQFAEKLKTSPTYAKFSNIPVICVSGGDPINKNNFVKIRKKPVLYTQFLEDIKEYCFS